MANILVVEDELSVRQFVQNTLSDYHVLVAKTVSEAMNQISASPIDLMVLDLQLGAEDGLTVARNLRAQSPHAAIVILTGHGSLKSAIHAIELGAQAYLLKPIRPDELRQVVKEQLIRMKEERLRDELAQHMKHAVESILRAETTQNGASEIVTPHVKLYRNRYTATYDDHDLQLSPAQFRVLCSLIESSGEPVPPRTLVREALGYDVSENEAADLIKGYISQIRRKLSAHNNHKEHILTIRGQGYLWVD